MSYKQIKDLRPADFKRYCGVEPETFQRMVELVSKRLNKTRRKTGRPPKLTVEDQVLLTLEYWRSVPHALPSGDELGAARIECLPHYPAGGRHLDEEPSFSLAGQEAVAARKPRDRIRRRGRGRDAH